MAATLLQLAVEILTPTRRVDRDLSEIERRSQRTQRNLTELGEAGRRIGEDFAEGAERGRRSLEDLGEAGRRAGEDTDLSLNVDESEAERATRIVEELTRSIREADGSGVRITVNEEGALVVNSTLRRTDELADNLDNRNISLNVGGLAALTALGAAMGWVGERADLLQTTIGQLAVAKLPLMITGMTGAAGVAATTGAAVGALATALGQGAAGFVAIGGAAYAGAAGGLKAYTTLISSAVSASREAYFALNDQAQAQLDLQRNQILNTQASADFNAEINDSVLGLARLQAEVGNAAFPKFGRELDYWNAELAAFTPEIAATSGAVAAVAAGFSRWFRTAGKGRVLSDIVAFVSESTVKASMVLGKLGAVGVRVFHTLLGPADRLQDRVVGVAGAMFRWTESAEGARVIASTVALVETRMNQLLAIAGNVGRGLVGAFSALASSGVGATLLGDLLRLTQGFSRFGAEGTRSREMLVSFAREGVPVLRAAGGVVAALWREFVRVAEATSSLRMEGSKTSVLVAIFNALRDAVRPVGDTLIATFEALGPSIPALVTALGGLFNTFAGSSPVLKAYLDALIYLLEIFNGLPTPVKNAVANFAAISAILGGAGGGALIGFATGLAGIIFNLKLLAAVQGTTVFGMIGAAAGRFGTALRTAAVAVLGFLNPAKLLPAILRGIGIALRFMLGPWGLLITAVAIGVGLIIANWDKIRPALQPVIDAIRSGVDTAITFLKNLGTVLKAVFTGGVNTDAFKEAFASLPGPVQDAVEGIGRAWTGLKVALAAAWSAARPILSQFASGLRTGLSTAFRFLLSQARAALDYLRANWPAIRSAVMPVITAMATGMRIILVGAFKFALSNARLLVNFFRQNWPLIRTTATTVFNAVKTVITTVMRGILFVVRPVLTGIVAFLRQNGTQILAVLRSVWTIAKTTIQTAIRLILQVIKLAMQVITGDWKGAWQTVQNIVRIAWQMIQTNTRAALNILKNLIQIAWNVIRTVTSGVWNGILALLRSVWNGIRSAVSSAVSAVRSIIEAGWNFLRSLTQSVWDAILSFLRTTWDTIRSLVDAGIVFLRQVIEAGWNFLRDITTSAWDYIRTTIQDRIEQARAFVEEKVNAVRDFLSGAWDAIRTGAEDAWNAIKDAMVNPIETARGLIDDAISGIVGVINRVLEAVGLPTLEFAAGGSSTAAPASGRAFASGGSAYAGRGGRGTSGKSDRWHRWNEQMGNEWYIAEKGPRARQEALLSEAASAFDGRYVPGAGPRRGANRKWPEHRRERHRSRARAANSRQEAFGPTMYTVIPEMREVAEKVANEFGTPWNTYENHPPGYEQPYYRERSVDWWGGGGRGDPIGDVWTSVASRAQQLLGGNLDWILTPSNDPAGHWDHVHVTAFTGTGGGGTGGIGGYLRALAEKMWDELVQPRIDDLTGAITGDSNYVLLEAASKAVSDSFEGVKNWIFDQLGLGGGGEYKAGANLQEWAKNGLTYGGAFEPTQANIDSITTLAMKESGGDPRAQNPSGASGLMQMMPATFDAHKVSGGDSVWDPVHNVAASSRYQLERYGGLVTHSPYSEGGMAIGPHRALVGEKGEEMMIPLDKPHVRQAAQTALGTAALLDAQAETNRLLREVRSGLNSVDFAPAAHEAIRTGTSVTAINTLRSEEGARAINGTRAAFHKTSARFGNG